MIPENNRCLGDALTNKRSFQPRQDDEADQTKNVDALGEVDEVDVVDVVDEWICGICYLTLYIYTICGGDVVTRSKLGQPGCQVLACPLQLSGVCSVSVDQGHLCHAVRQTRNKETTPSVIHESL